HGKNYDAKNMMHVYRLLNMAEDIAVKGEIIVKRPERDFLLAIKNGEYKYDYLLHTALEKISSVSELFNCSALPNEPDEQAINRLLVEIRERFYSKC
ncbi:MAG TPA: nucleotidyltransferase, partial [Bacteroidia bacterium]|nr:nucleotidyltransferase [Bacteroidia bacterium]